MTRRLVWRHTVWWSALILWPRKSWRTPSAPKRPYCHLQRTKAHPFPSFLPARTTALASVHMLLHLTRRSPFPPGNWVKCDLPGKFRRFLVIHIDSLCGAGLRFSLNANLNRRTKEGFCSNISSFTCIMLLKDEKAALCHKEKKQTKKANAGGEKLGVRGRKLQIAQLFRTCFPKNVYHT